MYAPELSGPGSIVAFSPEECHYLAHVCRTRRDERVSVTDGRGALATVRIVATHPAVTGEVESLERTERLGRAWVWCGSPEGQRADWLVEKLAELGMEEWQPLECDRGDWGRSTGRIQRWRRLALAGMRQSRRRFLMEVREPLELGAALERIPEGAVRWLASPEGERSPRLSESTFLSVVAVGPSAGFTPAERDRLISQGFRLISLSDARLRTETAAIVWAARWGILPGTAAPPPSTRGVLDDQRGSP